MLILTKNTSIEYVYKINVWTTNLCKIDWCIVYWYSSSRVTYILFINFFSQKNHALNRPRVKININVYLIFYCLISLEGVKTMPIVLLFKAYKLHASLPNW